MSSTNAALRYAIRDLDLSRSNFRDLATMRERKAYLDATFTAYAEELVASEEAKRVEADDAALNAEALELHNARNRTTETTFAFPALRYRWREVARAARRMYGAEAKPVTLTTVEEMDALPIGSSVKDRDGAMWEKTLDTDWTGGILVNGPESLLKFYAPLTLSPEATA